MAHTIEDILDAEGRALLRGEFQRTPMAGLLCPPTPGNCAVPGETDPPPSRCHVCGESTEALQNARMHAVAGHEQRRHTRTGELLRFLVTHCDRCVGSAHCLADVLTPGAERMFENGDETGQHSGAVFGFCEPMPPAEVTLGMFLFPGAHILGRVLRWGVAASGLWLLSHAAIVTSRGQQIANFSGPVTSAIVPGDATSGHGFNAGLLRILSGSAPASGDAAETGTLGISWTMNATAFGAPSAATPTVTTAGSISNVNASASITAGYGRLVESADTFGLSTTLRRMMFSVGTSGADMNFNTLSISSGGACSVTSLTITHG